MADQVRHVQFNLKNDQGGQGGQGNNDQDGQVNNDQAVQVVQQNILARAQNMLAFKVEQMNNPELYRQKSKDNIIAIIFIRRIDNLTRTNNWTDTDNYTNVTNTLGGFAHD
jgi:hypothetical protein